MAETIVNGKNGTDGSERTILAEDEREQKERKIQRQIRRAKCEAACGTLSAWNSLN